MITLSNSHLTAEISTHGAELCSLRYNGIERLWHADSQFWGRHAPVLFPLVGSVWNKTFVIDGTTYEMGQHGFARDKDFDLVAHSTDHAILVLRSDDDTRQRYPRDFRLRIEYVLSGNTLHVGWLVTNDSECEMPYQIGAHPAFLYPGFDAEKEARGYLSFDKKTENLLRTPLAGAYADADKRIELPLDDRNMLPLNRTTFDKLDTIILEDSQTSGVTLHDINRKPVVTLRFPDMPVIGIWSPPGKNAPFVCLEPWAGRADRVGYKGEFKERDWAQCLAPHASQAYTYEIILH